MSLDSQPQRYCRFCGTHLKQMPPDNSPPRMKKPEKSETSETTQKIGDRKDRKKKQIRKEIKPNSLSVKILFQEHEKT